jgi:hypothetical protein
MASSGTESATSRHVTECLKQLGHRVKLQNLVAFTARSSNCEPATATCGGLYCHNHMHSVEILNIKARGTYNYHRAVKDRSGV